MPLNVTPREVSVKFRIGGCLVAKSRCRPLQAYMNTYRWNRFVIEGSKEEKGMDAEQSKSVPKLICICSRTSF